MFPKKLMCKNKYSRNVYEASCSLCQEERIGGGREGGGREGEGGREGGREGEREGGGEGEDLLLLNEQYHNI